MDSHKNALLTAKGREAMVRAVVEGGLSQAAAARQFNVTPKTVAKWVLRFRAEGVAGLQDRSSRPRSSPSQTAPAPCARVEARVEALRRHRCTGKQIAAEVGVSAATVSRILKRLGLNRLAALESAEPVRRYERAAPGEILHIDIKKLGKFNRIGHRIAGDRNGQSNTRGVGWESVHLAIDDHSRVAYPEILPDEKRGSRLLCLQRPALLSKPRRQGPPRHERQWLKLPIPPLRQSLAGAQDQASAHQTLHPQDHRKGRALRSDQLARMGLRPGLANLRSSRPAAPALASPLQLASTPWRHRIKTAHQQTRPNRGQPLEAPQLDDDKAC
jgi:transposase